MHNTEIIDFRERENFARGLHVSTDAIAYIKTLDLGECEKSRLLLYVIAENTFNDSFICVIGNEQLAYEVRLNERTVRRQIEALVDGRILLRKPRYPIAGGRLNDALRIRGFKRWYRDNHAVSKRAFKAKTLPDKMSGSPQGLPGKMSTRATGQQMSGDTGQQVSGTIETRNYPVKREEARERAKEDFYFDLEGKAVRDRLHHRFGAKIHDAWFARMAASPGDGGVAIAAVPTKFEKSWIETHYAEALADAFRDVWPSTHRVEIRVDQEIGRQGRAA